MTKTEQKILSSYVQNQDSGRFTSQDICDNLRETAEFSPAVVTEYMLSHGWQLQRDDDRLVWVKP